MVEEKEEEDEDWNEEDWEDEEQPKWAKLKPVRTAAKQSQSNSP